MSARDHSSLLRVLVGALALLVIVGVPLWVLSETEHGGDGEEKAKHAAAPSRDWPSEACRQNAARAAQRKALVTGHGRRIVVIADSWAIGRHMKLDQTWPVFLHGETHVDAFGGSGFSAMDVNRCGGVSFADRAPDALANGADLVVIEGGLNDVNRSDQDIRTGLSKLLDEVAGHHVVMLEPMPAPSHASKIGRVDDLMSQMAAARGIPYIHTADLPVTYRPDGLHPDVAGQRVFGTAVAKRIDRLPGSAFH